MSVRPTIENELHELNSRIPAGLSQNPYSVPAGYFEGLAGQALAEIRRRETLEELQGLAPTLSGLSREIPYATPVGYFNRSVQTPGPAEPTPVVSIFRRTWMRYAVAAALLGAGIFIGLEKNNQTPLTANKVISEVEKEIAGLNEQEKERLEDFVAAGLTGQETAQLDLSGIYANGLLAEVSEQELTEFMEQTELITSSSTTD